MALVDEFFTLHPERRSLPQTAFPGTESTSGVSEEAVTLTMLCQDAVRIGTLRWTRQPDATNGHRRLRDCCLGAFTLFYDVLGAPPPECLANTTPPNTPDEVPRPSALSSPEASSAEATSTRRSSDSKGNKNTNVDKHTNNNNDDDERNDEK